MISMSKVRRERAPKSASKARQAAVIAASEPQRPLAEFSQLELEGTSASAIDAVQDGAGAVSAPPAVGRRARSAKAAATVGDPAPTKRAVTRRPAAERQAAVAAREAEEAAQRAAAEQAARRELAEAERRHADEVAARKQAERERAAAAVAAEAALSAAAAHATETAPAVAAPRDTRRQADSAVRPASAGQGADPAGTAIDLMRQFAWQASPWAAFRLQGQLACEAYRAWMDFGAGMFNAVSQLGSARAKGGGAKAA
jgi:hypothetical protein